MLAPFSPGLVLRGFDGRLFDANTGEFLAEVNTFHAQEIYTNTDYQPAGSALTVAIMQSRHVTLTFTSTVFRDKWLSTMATAKASNQQPTFNFQGALYRVDGSTGRYSFFTCVPDGGQDILNVAPGQVLTRSYSFRCNGDWALQAQLGA